MSLWLLGFIDGSFVTPLIFIKKVVHVITGDTTYSHKILESIPEFDIWDTKEKIVIN